MSENTSSGEEYKSVNLSGITDPSSFSSAQLLECLKLNRKLQDNLTLRLSSIEQARVLNLKQQKRITQFAFANGISNNFKNGPVQGSQDMSQGRNKYKANLPYLITGDPNEDLRLREIANFDYLPYFVANEDKVPFDNIDKILKDKVPPLIRSARKWQLREVSLLAAGVRQENIRLKIEEILKRTYGSEAVKEGDGEDKSKLVPSNEIWEVRKLPDRALELNLNGLNWEKIAQHVPGRNPKECAIRWTCYDHPFINKAEWTEEEEAALAKIAKAHSYRNWPAIASELKSNRTAIQCFHQYQSKLNHNLSRKRWTKEEDNILREAVHIYGERNWQQIAQCLENRSGQQCLHRWAKALNPSIKRGRWTSEEDEALKAAVAKYGAHSWVKIQPHVKGRTDVQCRERWMNVLHPGIDDSFWNPYEDALLLSLVNKIGVGKWSSISQEITNRTDNQCWRRWKRLVNVGVVNSDLIKDKAVIANLKPKNKKIKINSKKGGKRDEDDSEDSDGDMRYRNAFGDNNALEQIKTLKSTLAKDPYTASAIVRNNIKDQEEPIKDAIRAPIGGGLTHRKTNYKDQTWASIDHKITVHIDSGKPLPPVLGNVNLYKQLLNKSDINNDNFNSIINEDKKVSNETFEVDNKDFQKLKDVFQCLFVWPHISGSLMVQDPNNLKAKSKKQKDSLPNNVLQTNLSYNLKNQENQSKQSTDVKESENEVSNITQKNEDTEVSNGN